jgi:hypothetical protein
MKEININCDRYLYLNIWNLGMFQFLINYWVRFQFLIPNSQFLINWVRFQFLIPNSQFLINWVRLQFLIPNS